MFAYPCGLRASSIIKSITLLFDPLYSTIARTERRTHKSVLKERKPGNSLEGIIVKRVLSFFGHTIPADGMELDSILGKVEGTRRRGKQRTS